MESFDTFREIASPIARFGSFASNAILFGLVPILLLALRPGFQALGETWERAAVADRLEGLIQGALLASAFSTFFLILIQAMQIAEIRDSQVDASAIASVFDSSYGTWLGFRIPLLISLAVLLVGTVKARSLRDVTSRYLWALWGGVGLALLMTSTFSGHAAVATPRVLSEINDIIHLVSTATWFTGIVVLAWALPIAWRYVPEESHHELLTPVVTRFSRLAVVSISVIIVTGSLNSLLHVGALNDLLDTGYGRTVAVKILLLIGILGLGAVNHFVVRRRLERATGDGASTRRLFKRTIVAELVVAIALMAATGLLTDLARTGPVPTVTSTTSVQR